MCLIAHSQGDVHPPGRCGTFAFACDYFVPEVSPSLRRRSCSLRRSVEGVLGLNATRYHSGWLRSRESKECVVGSALGWRATFSRMGAYGCRAGPPSVFEETL